MKIIVIGATGTIGSEVVKALSLKRHEVVHASRNGEVKVTLDDPASVRALFERVRNVDAVVSCAGNAAFKPFADLTDADYELGLRSKLMGQVSLARAAKDALRDSGSKPARRSSSSDASQPSHHLRRRGRRGERPAAMAPVAPRRHAASPDRPPAAPWIAARMVDRRGDDGAGRLVVDGGLRTLPRVGVHRTPRTSSVRGIGGLGPMSGVSPKPAEPEPKRRQAFEQQPASAVPGSFG